MVELAPYCLIPERVLLDYVQNDDDCFDDHPVGVQVGVGSRLAIRLDSGGHADGDAHVGDDDAQTDRHRLSPAIQNSFGDEADEEKELPALAAT